MKKLYIRMFFRTFLLQSLWNYERMQNLGFLFVIKPFIDFLYKSPEDRKAAFLRHCGHFNTHPYMAHIIIPLCANAEKRLQNKDNKAQEDINFYKTAMAGSLAAVGDSFFWGTFRTCAAIISTAFIISAFFIGYSRSSLNLVIPFIFLFVFNAFHLPVRVWFSFAGFSVKGNCMDIISKLHFKLLLRLMKIFAFFSLIILNGLYISYFRSNISALHSPIFNIIYIAVLFCAAFAISRFSPVVKLYSFAAFGILISFAGF
ncbi:MAG: PTS system mannose/fructose/sorbose family transporter subunit IID [Elusimicrobiota bacterium]|nr:PTS system mannose/fructose/sorbose family transporter subunit IID [Elusimicrobiota bacterium]